MAKTGELVLRANELQVLLNVLHEKGERLTLDYPFFDVEVLSYDPATGELVSVVPRGALEDARERYLPKTQRLQEDLLGWDDLRDVFLAAGALDYANGSERRAELARDLEVMQRGSRPNPTFLAFDTNAFYDRLLRDRSDGPPAEWGLGRAADGFQVVVSPVVKEELGQACNHKYGDGDVQSLGSKVLSGRLAQRLLNRRTKKARKATAGFSDLARLEKSRRVARAPEAKLGQDSAETDSAIATSYGEFRTEVRSEVILVTADNAMQYPAQAKSLTTCFLQVPRLDSPPTGHMDERVLARVVHDLVVAAGVLEVESLGLRLWADWSGKTPDDWQAESIRVEYADETRHVRQVLKDVDAVRKLESLFSP